MSERTLQHVLAVLRERLPGKLKSSSASSKGAGGSSSNTSSSIDVYRGHGFQFAWYLKKLDKRHEILLKDRQLVFDTQAQKKSLGVGEDIDITQDAAEEESKPRKRINYTGFSIYGHQLVIIVEPYPPIEKKESNQSGYGLGLDEPQEQGELVRDGQEAEGESETSRPTNSRWTALSIEDFLKANRAQKRTGKDMNRTRTGAEEQEQDVEEEDQQIIAEGAENSRENGDLLQGLLNDDMGLGSFEDQSGQVLPDT